MNFDMASTLAVTWRSRLSMNVKLLFVLNDNMIRMDGRSYSI